MHAKDKLKETAPPRTWIQEAFIPPFFFLFISFLLAGRNEKRHVFSLRRCLIMELFRSVLLCVAGSEPCGCITTCLLMVRRHKFERHFNIRRTRAAAVLTSLPALHNKGNWTHCITAFWSLACSEKPSHVSTRCLTSKNLLNIQSSITCKVSSD